MGMGEFPAPTEPYAARGYSSPRATSVPNRHLSAGSNQDEIDQRDQGGAYAGSDQGVVGPEVGLRIERGWVGFLGHFGGLGQAGPDSCEADHIGKISLTLGVAGNSWAIPGLVMAGFCGQARNRGAGNRRWAGNFRLGDRATARDCGCRCWLTPWKRPPARNSAACPAIGRLWRPLARSSRVRRRPTPTAHRTTACEIKRFRPIRPQSAAGAACRARSRAISLLRG
jgi:hypothetical protein